jgi:hypothetical protein
LDIYCYGGYDETVTHDGGVKDPSPAGYADSGAAWVATTGKTAHVVAA